MANVVAAGILARGEEKPPTVAIKSVEHGDKGNGKSTYGLTMKKLKADEEKRHTEIQERPLQRHIATVGFYFLAALAIILPCLFLSKY
jgi:VIT1/CCC1 family predicted Fe2+/Mn2+ transporter